jgi:DNA-binding IclR family transcriptional regulator
MKPYLGRHAHFLMASSQLVKTPVRSISLQGKSRIDGATVSESEATRTYKVQVLDRAIGLLDVLATSPSGLQLAEISNRLGLHKSTVYRLLAVLEQYRLVEKSVSGKFHLGLKLFELGTQAVAGLDLREQARPHLEKLAFEASETVHLCVLNAGEVVYLEKVEPERSVRLSSSVGRRNPAHCTAVGKAILAHLPESEVDAIIQQRGLQEFTRYTLTTPLALKSELEQVRAVGYARDWEEHEYGVNCLGSVVRDYSSNVVAAISVSGPAFRVNDETLPALSRVVISAAAAISADLGFIAAEAARSMGR